MTHEYTLLLGGTVLAGEDPEPATAIAWAAGTVLALGSDDEIRSISRGDSMFVPLRGAFVVPLGPDADEPPWPPQGTLEIGAPADMAILAGDPRASGPPAPVLAVLRGGHAVRGRLPTAER